MIEREIVSQFKMGNVIVVGRPAIDEDSFAGHVRTRRVAWPHFRFSSVHSVFRVLVRCSVFREDAAPIEPPK